jgi:hypothetical protein
MKTEKYLTTKEQMKVQFLRHEIDMLNKAISRTVSKRDELMKKVDEILSRVEK